MASPAADPDVPSTQQDRPEPAEPSHPEPACQEAQKWIEAVTGRSFGDRDFRSGLENGILLCELLSAIKPGVVKKINRLPTPIAGLDNLTVFLRGCEELGLKGSQLFDPGDLQDTSIRANLRDSDCNRKLKNVLNTVFWLGKAANGCASYSGPTLNLKEFEGLLAQMRMESEEGGEGAQKRGVRDSGYDCWDSERSESLSPPRHTRDNSLDSLDSFGSRSQHSPSPDVVNRVSDGRGSDSEADGPNRKPDVRRDDMLARRTASSESRTFVPFNQFLPNRANASSYIPAPRRKPRAEEGEQRSQVDGVDHTQNPTSSTDLPSWMPEVLPRPTDLDARLAQYEKRAKEEEEEEEEEEERVPDLQKDDMMARRTRAFKKSGSAVTTYNRFLPLPASKRCTQEEVTVDAAPRNKREVQAERNKKLNTRAAQQQPLGPVETPPPRSDMMVIRATSHNDNDEEEADEYDENGPLPDPEKDDMMTRRTGTSQKSTSGGAIHSFNQFLPTPGSVKLKNSPLPRANQVNNRPKLADKMPSDSFATGAAEPRTLPSKAPTRKNIGIREKEEEEGKKQGGDETIPNTSVATISEPASSPSVSPPLPIPPAAQNCSVETHVGKKIFEEKAEERAEYQVEEKVEDEVEDKVAERTEEKAKEWRRISGGRPMRRPQWLEEDDLPPMMMSRRVAFMSEDTESMSMGDMLSEEEVGHIQPLSRSRFERMHEQYSNYEDEEDQWQDDLARWKNRRRSASQELIKKEEERKRMEKRLKEEGSDSNKRKSIKTYREIVEEKERREVDLCEAYRKAKTPEEAAMVLQRYALRFAISDATLDSLKLPRSTSSEFNLILQDQEQNPTDSITDSEASDAPHKPEQTDRVDPCPTHDDINTDAQEEPVALSPRPEAQNIPSASVTHSRQTPPQLQELRASQPHSTQSPTLYAQPGAQDAQPQAKQAPPAMAQGQPQPMQPLHTHSSPLAPPCRPVPLLSAKPYCQPRSTYSGQKSVKADGLVRVNGEVTEEVISATSPASSPLRPPLEDEDAPSEQPCGDQSTVEQRSPQREEKASTSSGSVISSLIGGRSRIVKTTIVTELTRVEPPTPDITSNGKVRDTFGLLENPAAEESETVSAVSPCSAQAYSPTVTEGLEESSVTIETPMLNLAKRVNHWVWDPNEERKRQERWQQEQERLLQAQYQREQEKLKEEWERAQREVEEEERKHNEEERRILEETAAPLQHSASSIQPASQTGAGPPPQIGHRTGGRAASTEHNGQRVLAGNEDQHASKLHFFQDSSCNSESSKKTEMWKTSSLDRNAQISQTNAVKRSGSHDNVIGTHQSPSSVPQPPSPSRCVSGKRLCSGCSQPLGKGAAMNIDTLGLFFHIQCFKCGVCDGQLGDTSTGTDVRIRNGLLSCHECYIASRGGGQPTTL
ncbi:LIM and calponin homology domains-containing protein 1a isoform X2 [Lampris incognitus]|uniref:LIM and calponin homology domains-containing protein 1a isoform X2 n=1 Tax=Lampris incognitus TaxID=2546036 RepID=UPI0024B5C480|nr:LIM and calponin homology domains-containing protein 1a isoform X2 [Lampris incognitus]